MLGAFFFVTVSTLDHDLGRTWIKIYGRTVRQPKLDPAADLLSRDFAPFTLKDALNTLLCVLHLAIYFDIGNRVLRALSHKNEV